jgi:hypothetical protein
MRNDGRDLVYEPGVVLPKVRESGSASLSHAVIMAVAVLLSDGIR